MQSRAKATDEPSASGEGDAQGSGSDKALPAERRKRSKPRQRSSSAKGAGPPLGKRSGSRDQQLMAQAHRSQAGRRILMLGAGLLIAGLALVGTGPSDIGKFATLGGLLVLIYGIHRFGRLGEAPRGAY